MRRDQRVGIAKRQGVVAGPAIVAWIGHHRSAQRIEFDIALAAHQIVAIVDKARFVAALPQRACAVVGGIDVADIAPSKRLHGPRHCTRAWWRQKQVDVVGHQNVGMYRTPFATGHISKFTAVAEVVLVCEEARLAVIAPLYDMLRDAGKVDSEWAGHGGGRHGNKCTA